MDGAVTDTIVLVFTLGPLLGYALAQAIIEWNDRENEWLREISD